MKNKIFTQKEFALFFEALSCYSIEIRESYNGKVISKREENRIQNSITKLEAKLEKI